MAYEWDESKNFSNFLKHRARFEDAVLVFNDPYALYMNEDSSSEIRFICIGLIPLTGYLTVVFCERGEFLRIISARKATSAERGMYEKRVRF